MLGEDHSRFYNTKELRDAVAEYNNTPHKAFNYDFSPQQVQENNDIENYFIRENLYKLDEVKARQVEAGFFGYKPGNVLLINKDKRKLNFSEYYKKRRTFNRLAIFIRYNHVNVVCQELIRTDKKITTTKAIEVPVYCTKLLAKNVDGIPQEYLVLIYSPDFVPTEE
jgi:hypothetical protein